MPSPNDIVLQAINQAKCDGELGQLNSGAFERLKAILEQAVSRETEACAVAIWNAVAGKERDALVERFARARRIATADELLPADSNINSPFWTSWYPGLENDAMLVRDVVATLPGIKSEEVPAIIRAFENPASPLKLPGACTLEQHDVLHVLLGRGLMDQDEAFVLGFTAASDPAFSDADVERYKTAFSIYPEPYCIRGTDLIAFELGTVAARRMGVQRLYLLDTDSCMGLSVGVARRQLGIDKEQLLDVYEEERRRIPGTPWSHRLPRRSVESHRS